jgi:hypothetical protein
VFAATLDLMERPSDHRARSHSMGNKETLNRRNKAFEGRVVAKHVTWQSMAYIPCYLYCEPWSYTCQLPLRHIIYQILIISEGKLIEPSRMYLHKTGIEGGIQRRAQEVC